MQICVNNNIILCFVFFLEHEEYFTNTEKRKKVPKKEPSCVVVEAPRAEGYYCIEYNMLPDEPEPIRADLVMFGTLAKIYMGNETKVNYWN